MFPLSDLIIINKNLIPDNNGIKDSKEEEKGSENHCFSHYYVLWLIRKTKKM